MKQLLETTFKRSTSTLFVTEDPSYCMIEWHDKAINEVEHIGIWLEDYEFIVDKYEKATLSDYDGVFALPEGAIKCLKEAGIVVPEEFTS